MMDKRGNDDVTYALSREKKNETFHTPAGRTATEISLERIDPEQGAEIRRV